MSEQDPSYLSTYGITNPWAVWLLGKQPEMLSEDARSFSQSDIAPPYCPQHFAQIRMHWRPGAYKCYFHEPPFEIAIEHEYDKAPKLNVLDKLEKTLDYRWNPGRCGDHGYWEVVEAP